MTTPTISQNVSTTDYKYLVLYLTPKRLFEDNELLKIQWRNISTIIPCMVEILRDGKTNVAMDIFERVFSGLEHASSIGAYNVLGKVSTLWYFLTKRFHQSIGPRKGNFMEELVECWLKQTRVEGGRNRYIVLRNKTLGSVLREITGIYVNSRSQIDFAIYDPQNNTFSVVELRANEKTGGRTAQQSLLDKFDKILEFLEDPNKQLRNKLIERRITRLNLDIAILFSERTFELLDISKYSKGRFSSLVSYIMDYRHVWGRFNDLRNKGYVMCDGIPINEHAVKNALINRRDACIKKGNFEVHIRILFGDEFFRKYTGKSLYELIKQEPNLIADDLWLFYTLTLNEIKLAQESEFKQTYVRQAYELLSRSSASIFTEFKRLFNGSDNLEVYIKEFNERILNRICVSEIYEAFKKAKLYLAPLETNNAVMINEYIKQICIGVLALYQYNTISEYASCKWGEETEE